MKQHQNSEEALKQAVLIKYENFLFRSMPMSMKLSPLF